MSVFKILSSLTLILFFSSTISCSNQDKFGNVGTANPLTENPTVQTGEPVAVSPGSEDDSHEEEDDCDEEEPAEVERPQSSEMSSCSRELGIPVQRLMVAGKLGQVSLSADQALIVKVSGSRNHVSISVPEGRELAGVCVVSTGNLGRVRLNVKGKVHKAIYLTAGTQNLAELNIEPGGQTQSFSVLQRGNRNLFRIHGGERYTCSESGLNGGRRLDCAP